MNARENNGSGKPTPEAGVTITFEPNPEGAAADYENCFHLTEAEFASIRTTGAVFAVLS